MELTYVSISFYRSITNAYKMDLSNLTVLIGKNNEGKSNVLKAIDLGMNILINSQKLQRRKVLPKNLYDWHEDFPLSLQNSKKLKNKKTSIRMDFQLSESETIELNNIIHSNINGVISIFIEINESNTLSISIPKRGKNASALSGKLNLISKFICERFNLIYIPAIRSESDAFDVISDLVYSELSSIDDQHYKESLQYIEKKQQERLGLLAQKVKVPLEKFLPQIKSINLYMTDRYKNISNVEQKNLNIDMDDGVLTSLSNKGDGVKSLFTIAILSQLSNEHDRLILIDEPENHLHPDAVRYICTVLNKLALENQVLISTHSPIFVNRNCISSNWIVDAGQTTRANRIDDIRKTLGVICSDNLMYSDYVIVVEGPTDRTVLNLVLQEHELINKCINNKIVTVRSIGGINNLKSEIYTLQRYCCNFLILLDYDAAGKNAANDVKHTLSVPQDKIRFFMRTTTGEFELEDMYIPDLYKDYLLKNGFDITNPKFKNSSLKWSKRLESIGCTNGMVLSSEVEDKFKQEIASMIGMPVKNYVTEQAYELLEAICKKIEQDLMEMSLIC